MNHRLIRLLLLSYPSKWRDEFGSELEELLRRRAFRVGDVFNVLWGGFTERTREPFTRFLLYSLLGSALVFLTSELFARPLWRILVSPVTTALQQPRRGNTRRLSPAFTFRRTGSSLAGNTSANDHLRHACLDADSDLDFLFEVEG